MARRRNEEQAAMPDGQTMEQEQPLEQEQPESRGGQFATAQQGAQTAMLEAMGNQMAGAATVQTQRVEAVGVDQIREALLQLNRYKQGKAMLDQRIVDNEKWYRMRHWETLRRAGGDVEPVSGWLFNALANKHADSMDNYPTCTVQGREQTDEEEAKRLSSILPVVMDQCEFEAVYDAEQDYKLKFGAGCYGVFWDSGKLNGLGDISIRSIDILNLFWEPGVTDIQDSRNLFYVTMVDNDTLTEQYPELGDRVGDKSFTVAEYSYEDNVDTRDKTTVIDWYYKRRRNGKTVLHYCKFTGDTVLFASENEAEYAERGWYDHGLYPFHIDSLFRVAGSPCGFGYIDVGKSAQEYIDRGNQAVLQNMLANARPRHFIRNDGSVNEAEYADMRNDFIHVDGNLGEDSIKPVNGKVLNGIYVTVLNNKIDELKEVTGNRDISTGGTSSGVTAASAIAAMQEAGSKLSRDSNQASYRAFRKVCLLAVELIRQFYELPRCFRILGEQGSQEFISFTNAAMEPRSQGVELGVDMGSRIPLFDIEIGAEKQSPYSRLSQNEMAMQFFNAGLFDPARWEQALAALEIMDFDGKGTVERTIRENGQRYAAGQMQGMQERRQL